MDLTLARFNMVQQQIRPWDVLDNRILETLSGLPREKFVPEAYQSLSFSDTAIPIGHDQVMLPPKVVGRLLQSLNLKGTETVLEIGTGTGYVTAALAGLSHKVISLELFPELSKLATQHLQDLHINNVVLEIGDGILGWPKHGPYDAILLTGSLPFLPETFREQLSLKGRVVAVIGGKPIMSAIRVTRQHKEKWEEISLFETVIPPLVHAPKLSKFEF